MLTIVLALLVFDDFNSQPNSNLHDTEPIMLPLTKISNDFAIQSTYEQCRNKIISDFQKDNLNMPINALIMTLKSMPDICKDSIKASCKDGVSNKMCKFIMKLYQ
jgi:hypothetical protein